MNNEWYSFDDNQVDSYTDFTTGTTTEFNNRNYVDNNRNYVDFGTGYADFTNGTYTDLTEIRTNKPVKKKKKSAAGKVIFGVIAASVAVVAGTFLVKEGVVQACTQTIIDEYFSDDSKETAVNKGKKAVEEAAFELTEERTSYDKSSPAYAIAEDIMADLWRDDDINTAYEIFYWVHTNISYQTLNSYDSFEDAAYAGFTKRSGDCYVYFACSKMLLDVAGIPNLMVERYPVETNSHYWNLVQIDGLWYHCDATVFRNHPDMYFLCTDDEIDDGHHSFDSSLYPERAASYYGGDDYWDDSYNVYYEDSYYGPYYDDSYNDPYYNSDYNCNEDPYCWDDSYIDYDDSYGGYGPYVDYEDYDAPYGGYGPNRPNVDYEDYDYSYAPYEGAFMDSFEDAYVVNYN